MSRTRPTGALAIAFALVLAGCADDGETVADDTDQPAQTDDTQTDDTQTDEGDSDDSEADEAGDEVLARNISFDPDTITIEAGTTVTFTNEDVVRHTVTSGEPGEPDGEFDEDLPDQGDTTEITFDEPGTFAYYCDLHRDMTGEITVE